METNYTPINLNQPEKKDNGLNTVLLLIVTVTALVLAVMLFILIQKKIEKSQELPADVAPTIIPTKILPTKTLATPTVSTASPTIIETTTPSASPTSEINQ